MRYELLPFARAELEEAGTARPLTLTVTCSPRQGMHPAVDVACRLREMGHAVVLHLAARVVRGARLPARDGGHPDRRRRHVRERARRPPRPRRPRRPLRRAMAYGTALASCNVEAFGTERMVGLGAAEVRGRVDRLRELARRVPLSG